MKDELRSPEAEIRKKSEIRNKFELMEIGKNRKLEISDCPGLGRSRRAEDSLARPLG